ncbi:hypothetical protein L195_g040264, partial [Trifolium pratense]
GFTQAEPVTVSGLIQTGALQNATVAELDAAQIYLAAVDVEILFCFRSAAVLTCDCFRSDTG